MTRKEAEEFINAIVALRENVTDQQSTLAVAVYPKLKKNGELIKAGTRIQHDSSILRVAVDIYDTEENSPENAPTL